MNSSDQIRFLYFQCVKDISTIVGSCSAIIMVGSGRNISHSARAFSHHALDIVQDLKKMRIKKNVQMNEKG